MILDTTKEYVVEAYIFVESGGPVSLLMNSEVIGDTGSSISEWIMISTEDYVPGGNDFLRKKIDNIIDTPVTTILSSRKLKAFSSGDCH